MSKRIPIEPRTENLKTPRTNSKLKLFLQGNKTIEHVNAKFARELETELTEAKELLRSIIKVDRESSSFMMPNLRHYKGYVEAREKIEEFLKDE